MRTTSLPRLGAVSGALLLVAGLLTAGGGHGSYLLLSLIAAPLSWFPAVGGFVAPLFWATVGIALRDGARRRAAVLLGVHTVAAVGIVFAGNAFEPGEEQWAYYAHARGVAPALLWAGLVLYGTCLSGAWWLTLAGPSPTTRQAG